MQVTEGQLYKNKNGEIIEHKTHFPRPGQRASACSDPSPLLTCLSVAGCIFPSSPAIDASEGLPQHPHRVWKLEQAQYRVPKSADFRLKPWGIQCPEDKSNVSIRRQSFSLHGSTFEWCTSNWSFCSELLTNLFSMTE